MTVPNFKRYVTMIEDEVIRDFAISYFGRFLESFE